MENIRFRESFDQPELHPDLKWHCEPSKWKVEDNQLIIATDSKTDFWQRTHYGFRADNGHFLYTEIEGDFVFETHVKCDFKHQYDQAGVMVYVSEDCWVKSSVEFELDDPSKLGAVVTNHGYSDWSTQDVDDSLIDFKLRIIRKGSDYIIQSFDEKINDWTQLRMFHLFDEAKVKVGVYCCSPKMNGFQAHFNYLKIA